MAHYNLIFKVKGNNAHYSLPIQTHGKPTEKQAQKMLLDGRELVRVERG